MRIVYQKKSFWESISLTVKIIVFTVLTSILGYIFLLSFGEEFFLKYIAINPISLFSEFSLWTFITSVLVHGSFFHLAANMFSLFFLGNFLEKLIGSKRFFWVYLISGIFGGIFYVASAYLFGNPNISAVGASGAIFGLLGVLAVLTPHSKIYLIVGPLMLLFLQVVLSNFIPVSFLSAFNLIINILFFVMLFSMFSFNSSFRKFAIPLELKMWVLPIVAIVPLVVVGFFVSLPIGNSAHLGGLVFGLLYGYYLRKKFPNKTRIIRNMFR